MSPGAVRPLLVTPLGAGPEMCNGTVPLRPSTWQDLSAVAAVKQRNVYTTGLTAITPFNVIQGHRFWEAYQSKPHIYNFQLVINTNLPPLLYHLQVMADYWSNFTGDRETSL